MPGMLIVSWPCVWFNADTSTKSHAILHRANGYPQVRPPRIPLKLSLRLEIEFLIPAVRPAGLLPQFVGPTYDVDQGHLFTVPCVRP
jgi:hypothetical protein